MWHTQAGYWQQYAETELAAGNTDAVKSIFGRCLLHNLHVDLWRLYLRFIKQVGAWRGARHQLSYRPWHPGLCIGKRACACVLLM